MKKYDVFRADSQWLDNVQYTILRRAERRGIKLDQIQSGEINCGSAGGIGAVILKTGERIDL